MTVNVVGMVNTDLRTAHLRTDINLCII